jgi:hypothetical protein
LFYSWIFLFCSAVQSDDDESLDNPYTTLSYVQLQNECRFRGLSVVGTKSVMMNRLLDNDLLVRKRPPTAYASSDDERSSGSRRPRSPTRRGTDMVNVELLNYSGT